MGKNPSFIAIYILRKEAEGSREYVKCRFSTCEGSKTIKIRYNVSSWFGLLRGCVIYLKEKNEVRDFTEV
jgi:hypothetical protein